MPKFDVVLTFAVGLTGTVSRVRLHDVEADFFDDAASEAIDSVVADDVFGYDDVIEVTVTRSVVPVDKALLAGYDTANREAADLHAMQRWLDS